MAKMKSATVYFCQNCGYESSKWMGQCPGCREWNTLVEEVVTKASGVRAVHMVQPTSLNDISMEEEDKLLTHMSELDRVLGGGIVPGAAYIGWWRSRHREIHHSFTNVPEPCGRTAEKFYTYQGRNLLNRLRYAQCGSANLRIS